MTPNEMTRRAVDATLSLSDVIDEENKALAQARVERVTALQDAKQTAADAFEARLRELKDNPDLLTQAAPTMRMRTCPTGGGGGDGCRRNLPYRPRWMCRIRPPSSGHTGRILKE